MDTSRRPRPRGLRAPSTGVLALSVALAASFALPSAASVRPGTTTRLSVSPTGQRANDNTDGEPAISANGRYVAFASYASNLVAGDDNGGSDVFRRDLRTGRTTLVSVGTDGKPAASCSVTHGSVATIISRSPSISASGRYVLFSSCSPDLVPGLAVVGGVLRSQVYLRDLRTGSTTLVSVGTTGLPAALGAESSRQALSADGRLAVFVSQSPELVPGTPSGTYQVYLRSLRARRTTVVSRATWGTVGNADSGRATWRGYGVSVSATIDATGRAVAFASSATNLGGPTASPGDPGSFGSTPVHVYLHDLTRDTTRMVDVGMDGRPASKALPTPAGCPGPSGDPSVAAGGRYVVFTSTATDLVPKPRDPALPCLFDVYVRDMRTGRVERADVTSWGGDSEASTVNAALEFAQDAELSSDGRYVVFAGHSKLTPEAYGHDIYLHDRRTGTTELISRSGTGAPGDAQSSFSDCVDGRYVAFGSLATNLDGAGGAHTFDLFLRDRGPAVGTGTVVTTQNVAAVNPVTPAISGTSLTGAAMILRPESGDAYFRLQVQRMPTFALASPGAVYGIDVTVAGTSYQVRAAKTGVAASYGLFREGPGGTWTPVATLRGGYGTTGQEVDVSVPLADLGARTDSDLTAVSAFTGLGSYYAGAVRVVDRAVL